MNKKIYYNQNDPRWANHSYASSGHPKATISSGGCGPTSAAALVTSLTNNVIYPDQMGDLFKKNGYRAAEGTDLARAVNWLAATYNLEMKKVKTDDELINYIANGYVALVSVYGGSVFSTGGHIMFIAGYADGLIQVHDSNLYKNKFETSSRRGKVQVVNNDVWISNENWKNFAKCNLKYVFKIPEDPVIPSGQKYKNGQKLLVHIPIAECIRGDFCLVDSNNYQFWVFNSLLDKAHQNVHCLMDVEGYDEITQCYHMIVFPKTIYETKFDCKEIYLSDKFN